jgi:hypothetical protein
MENTYLLLHPCSNVFVNHIFTTLKQWDFTIVAVYRILGWDTVLDEIYKNTYSKSITVEEHVQSHAYINKHMFGNCGLILLLNKRNMSYDDLVKETLGVKLELRKAMNKTKDGTISIFLNANRSIYNSAKLQEEKLISTFLSYIHCPDTVEQYFEDFETLSEHLKSEKKLKQHEIENILDYRSYYCGEDLERI